jgi:hypothetical protein
VTTLNFTDLYRRKIRYEQNGLGEVRIKVKSWIRWQLLCDVQTSFDYDGCTTHRIPLVFKSVQEAKAFVLRHEDEQWRAKLAHDQATERRIAKASWKVIE